MEISIRNEAENDYRKVEEITREAFWNLYVPGCNEHYLVHVLRDHPDFIGYLDLVAEYEGRLIGNIMFTKSYVVNEVGQRMDTLTFGPVSVLPIHQRKGVGSALIKNSIEKAIDSGYKAVIIYGDPQNYCKHGFKNGKDFGVSAQDGSYPYGLLVLELEKGVFDGHSWKFHTSEAYEFDNNAAEEFDDQFKPKAKEHKHTQDVFSIQIRAALK
jgi:putative acetyltransferase